MAEEAWKGVIFMYHYAYELAFLLVICHLIGDYVLQSEFLAVTKGENWYHLFVHCALYIVPFYYIFGFRLDLLFLFVTHFAIDMMKARYQSIGYVKDQVFHYICLILYGIQFL